MDFSSDRLQRSDRIGQARAQEEGREEGRRKGKKRGGNKGGWWKER